MWVEILDYLIYYRVDQVHFNEIKINKIKLLLQEFFKVQVLKLWILTLKLYILKSYTCNYIYNHLYKVIIITYIAEQAFNFLRN